MRRGRAVALAAALALGGCGSDGEDVSVPRAAPTVATTASTQVPAPADTVAAAPAPRRSARGARRPPIVQRPIPYGPRRRRDMAAYSRRHYGDAQWRLEPLAVVHHFTQLGSVDETWRAFARNRPDPELGELPGTCAHFVIDRDGTIFQLVDEHVRCRHAFGVNHVALGVEHVAFSDGEVIGNRRQLAASLALTRWLACRYAIPVRDVLGHAETVRSDWYTELRPDRHTRSTHSDFSAATMRGYRARLSPLRCG